MPLSRCRKEGWGGGGGVFGAADQPLIWQDLPCLAFSVLSYLHPPCCFYPSPHVQGFQVGMHAALQINPYYGKTSKPGLLAHFKAVLAEGPAIVYNVPGRTSECGAGCQARWRV